MRLPENCTSKALANGQTFTGIWRDVSEYSTVILACYTDTACTLYADFSPEGIFTDSTITYEVDANVNEVHRITASRPYFRLRITNDSGSNQTFLRATSMAGFHNILSSPLNSSIQLDADAIVVKAIDSENEIAAGRVNGTSVINKYGKNPDIDAATVPEDLWGNGGTYTGFPTGSPETIEAFSDSASDTGTLTITYLATSASEEYQTANVTLQGTTPVSIVSAYRVHTANYSSGNATAANVGTITIRHSVTTANVFLYMSPGVGQTYSSGFTIPANTTGLIKRFFVRVAANATNNVEGGLWVRALNGSPRLRRPFTCGNTVPFQEEPYGGLSFSAGTDLIVRVTNTFSSNNVEVVGGYDIVLIKNQ